MGTDTNFSLPAQPPVKGGEISVRPKYSPTVIHKSTGRDEAEAKSLPVAKVPQINLEQLKENLEQLEKKMDRKLSFSIDETIDRIVIIVRNEETGEEIRKLPDEATLKVAHSIENLKGLLFDDAL